MAEGMMGGAGMAGMWIPFLSGMAFLTWVLAGVLRRKERPVAARAATAEDVLRERLVRGEISPREF